MGSGNIPFLHALGVEKHPQKKHDDLNTVGEYPDGKFIDAGNGIQAYSFGKPGKECCYPESDEGEGDFPEKSGKGTNHKRNINMVLSCFVREGEKGVFTEGSRLTQGGKLRPEEERAAEKFPQAITGMPLPPSAPVP